jgi:uncharacterized protein YbbK (DUF523 family)
MTNPDSSRVRIGISSCLLGENVRFDGGHKKDDFLTNHFGRFVEWVPVCPEAEIGLGIPRESLRLVADGRQHSPRSSAFRTRSHGTNDPSGQRKRPANLWTRISADMS